LEQENADGDPNGTEGSHLADQPGAVAGEHECEHQRLHQVVRQRHPAGWR